ncbi:uncharacterized protein LOC131620054 [Vicia villosa]|uniref:uncharacterized protein LOC131620054 n=1 Tax=Vicia villosa TaxID=3911 RepID=UPI00273BF0E8|nr:uncharacterized protein LOC131620054 [Vicia villosa]
MTFGYNKTNINTLKTTTQIFSDAKSIIFDICSREDKKDVGRFAMVLENLWKSRNNIVWNNNRKDLARIGIQAYYNWFDCFNVQDVHVLNIDSQFPLVWTPPAVGWLKCNVDAGFNNHYQTMNRAWCLRDNLGRFIVAGVAWDKGITSPIEVEALALKEAIHIAITMNLNNLIFESDSQVRQANMVADSLVKAANSWSRRNFVNVVPPCIDIHLVNDMS